MFDDWFGGFGGLSVAAETGEAEETETNSTSVSGFTLINPGQEEGSTYNCNRHGFDTTYTTTTYAYDTENRLKAVREQGVLLQAMTYDGDGNLAYELDYNVDAVVDGRCIYFPTHGTKAEHDLYRQVCDNFGWVRGDYTLTEYLNDVTRENVEVLAEYGRNYCSVTVYTYGNERIAATTFNGYGFHFGCHDHGYHNIFNHYEKWHDRWQIKDRWHNSNHNNGHDNNNNRPRIAEATYSIIDSFRATYGSYSTYHSGKYCGHKWKTAMSKIYYLYDGHGSVERVHGKDGSTFRLEYNTYGNLVAGIVEKWHVWYNDIFAHRTANIYAYSGERYNFISGLQFLRARWYDTDTGRFISEDSYLGTQAEPLSRNRYIYTANNPVNYIDPSGHKKATGAAVSAIGSKNQLVGGVIAELLEMCPRENPKTTVGEMVAQTVKNTKTLIMERMQEAEDAGKDPGCDNNSDYLVTAGMLKSASWKTDAITNEMLQEINEVLYKYEILNQESIIHFLAQVSVESDGGIDCIEDSGTVSPEIYFADRDFRYAEKNGNPRYYKEDGSILYYNDAPDYPAEQGDGAKFRGAGYIQLTWKCNYYEFAKSLDDEEALKEILEGGAEVVAEKYAWAAAAWFWTNKKINDKIESGEITTVEQVTSIVNGGDSALDRRQEIYNVIKEYCNK